MLAHPLDSDSDCSDNEEDADYASLIKTKLSRFNDLTAKEKGSGDYKDTSEPERLCVDLILSFVSHKVLSCPQVKSSYEKIKSPLEFAKNKTPNDKAIHDLITKQHTINNDLKNCFLFIPVVSDTLKSKYDDFNTKKASQDNINLHSIEEIVHKVQILLSVHSPSLTNYDIDFVNNIIKPFIEYCAPNESTIEPYTDIALEPIGKQKALNNKFLVCVKKHFIKDRAYHFPHDIIRISPKERRDVKQELNIEQCNKLFESARIQYKTHKKDIDEIQSAIATYEKTSNYREEVEKLDFLPQVLYYARTIKNLIKKYKILSPSDSEISINLPNVPECIPVKVTIYNTFATNLFVHNVGSYANIAQKNIFNNYLKYCLNPTPEDLNSLKEIGFHVLMQIEVIRNPSALLTNVMFLLLVQANFKSLRHVDEQDSDYCWTNIEKQLPIAMKNATKASLSIEYKLFLKGLISGKRLFDYRQIINNDWDEEEQLSYRNSDIFFDWICYKIDAKQIVEQLNNNFNATTLTVKDIQYSITPDNGKIILTSTEYELCFKASSHSSTHGMNTRSMIRKEDTNKDGNSTCNS